MKGRRVLITGGDSGIGRAAAITSAREGADVLIAGLHPEGADAASIFDLIRQAGVQGECLAAEISKQAKCTSLIRQTVDFLGGLDVLVTNAGKHKSQQPIADSATDQLRKTR